MTGAELKAIRKRLGMTQGEFCKAIGLAGFHSRVSEYENGRSGIPGPVAKLASLFAAQPALAQDAKPTRRKPLLIDGPPYYNKRQVCGYCQRKPGEKHKSFCRQGNG